MRAWALGLLAMLMAETTSTTDHAIRVTLVTVAQWRCDAAAWPRHPDAEFWDRMLLALGWPSVGRILCAPLGSLIEPE